MSITFFVPGIPQPQGSARGYVVKGRAVITSDNAKLRPWRSVVTLAAREHFDAPIGGAVKVTATFGFPRPKSTPKRVTEKVTKPDLDKLLRALLDSLTGVAFLDDSQVVAAMCEKRFDETPGVTVTVWQGADE